MATQLKPVSAIPQSVFDNAASNAIATLFSSDPATTGRQRDSAAHLLLDAVEGYAPTAARARAQLQRAYQTNRLSGQVLTRYNSLIRLNTRRAAANNNERPSSNAKGPPASVVSKKRERAERDRELRMKMRGNTPKKRD